MSCPIFHPIHSSSRSGYRSRGSDIEELSIMTTTIRRSKRVVEIKRTIVGKHSGHGDNMPSLGRSLQPFTMGLVVLVLGCVYLTVPSLVFSSWRQRNLDSIEVWDGVLGDNIMEELRHEFFLRSQERGPDKRELTVAFPWPTSPSDLGRRNRIEQILSDIITQLYQQEENIGESKPRFVVEYWDRQNWISVYVI